MATLFEQRCRVCGEIKSLDAFPFQHKARGERAKRCRPCLALVNRQQRQKRAANGKALAYSRKRLQAMRDRHFQRKYGITIDAYWQMHHAQKGLCAICGKPESFASKYSLPGHLAVDHDHATGQIRALLCNHCNRGLAAFFDDSNRLAAAIKYLQRFGR